jgi:hypothetical protein
MHAIHIGSKHQLRQLQALFSSTRTRPEIEGHKFVDFSECLRSIIPFKVGGVLLIADEQPD